MLRSAILAAMSLSLASTAALAQSTANTAQSENIQDRSPFENSKAGAADARGPGSWVDRARSRHNTLIQQRVRGDGSGTGVASSGSSSSGGSSGGLSGLAQLIGLASQAGINLGGLGSTLGGASSTTIPSSGSTGTTNPGGTSGGGVTQQDIEAAGAGDAFNQLLQLQAGLNSQVRQNPLDAAFDDMGFLKDDGRSQQQTPTPTPAPEEEDSFQIRLVDSWLNTIFTALTLGFQSRDFIDILADGIRPILRPDLIEAGDDGSNGGNNGGSGGNNNGGSLDDLGNGSRV